MTFWILILVPVVFYCSGVYGMCCFGVLAKKWPKIMQQWQTVERMLPKHRNRNEKCQLAKDVRRVALVMLLCSLGKCNKKSVYLNLDEFFFSRLIFSRTHFEFNIDCEFHK